MTISCAKRLSIPLKKCLKFSHLLSNPDPLQNYHAWLTLRFNPRIIRAHATCRAGRHRMRLDFGNPLKYPRRKV